MLERLKSYSVGIEQQHVLDIGTASGLFARDLARQGCRVTGIDLSSELIHQAQQVNIKDQLPIEYLEGNVEHLPFEKSSYKVITAVYCWHWFNKLTVAEEVYRVLEDNGRLAIINYEWLPSRNSIALHTQTLIEEFNSTAYKPNETKMFPEWVEDIYKAGFSGVETFSFDINIPYSIEKWMGRIQASPEIGGSLNKEEISEFNSRLKTFLEEHASTTFNIPYRAYGIIGIK